MKGRPLVVLIFTCLFLLLKPGFAQVNKAAESPHAIHRMHTNPNDLNHYLDEASWDSLFPHRYGHGAKDNLGRQTDFYSLHTFIVAAGMFPGFLSEGDERIRKKELAAFLASIAYETGGGWSEAPDGYWRWGLYFREEKAAAEKKEKDKLLTKKEIIIIKKHITKKYFQQAYPQGVLN